MSTVFFSVDVESSGLNPFDLNSRLLSVGTVAMDDQGNELGEHYVRIDRTAVLSPEWFDARLETTNDTLLFWRDQDAVVRGEAWEDLTLPRLTPREAARDISEFVRSYGDNWEDRIFVANPATFDFAWLLSLWAETEVVENPFHYRTLCLRSQAFGASGSANWHTFPHRTHKPVTPHHPLSDAKAQAADFRDMVAAGKA